MIPLRALTRLPPCSHDANAKCRRVGSARDSPRAIPPLCAGSLAAGSRGHLRVLQGDPLLILLARHGGEPCIVVEIPVHGACKPRLEALLRRPPDLAPKPR